MIRSTFLKIETSCQDNWENLGIDIVNFRFSYMDISLNKYNSYMIFFEIFHIIYKILKNQSTGINSTNCSTQVPWVG